MTLSLIIPVLNEAPAIARALESLQALRARGHELIIADGGSRDTTVQIARRLVDRVIEAPRGRASQMNAGAEIARGDVLLFLHADTFLPSDAGRLIETHLSDSRPWGRFDVRFSGARPILRIVEFMMNLRSRLSGIATGDQAIFVRRALFERIGGYPEIPLMEDIALCRALRRHARPICLKEKVITSSRRWEQRGLWRTIFQMWRLRFAYFCGADPARLAARYYPRSTCRHI